MSPPPMTRSSSGWPQKFHDEYDEVVNAEQRAIAEKFGKERMALARKFTHEAWGRAGHHDPNARLLDMDRDGVEAEVLYCEVGGVRIYNKMGDCWRDAYEAFNNTLVDFAVGRVPSGCWCLTRFR